MYGGRYRAISRGIIIVHKSRVFNMRFIEN